MIRGMWLGGALWRPVSGGWAAVLPCGTAATVERRGDQVVWEAGRRCGLTTGAGVLVVCAEVAREAKGRAEAAA